MKKIKYAYSVQEDELRSKLFDSKEECIKIAKLNCGEDIIYIITLEETMFYPCIDEDKLFDDATEQYLENAYTENDWVDFADVNSEKLITHINHAIKDFIDNHCPKSSYWEVKYNEIIKNDTPL